MSLCVHWNLCVLGLFRFVLFRLHSSNRAFLWALSPIIRYVKTMKVVRYKVQKQNDIK